MDSPETMPLAIQRVAKSKIDQVDFDNIPFGRIYTDHMFVADYKDGDWQDLRIVPYEDLQLKPGSAILHYGQSIFEGLKCVKNEKGEVLIFRPEANARRMILSAERMCIPELPEDLFMYSIIELLKLDRDWVPTNPDAALYIRPFVFALDEYIGIRPSDTYRYMVITCPVGAYYSSPVKVKIETQYARAFEGGTGYAKTGANYATSLYPAMQAQKEGYHQLLWTDGKTHEYIEESGTMNVMFVIGDTLITSPTGDTILKGVTRDSVLTLARDMGLKVEERKIAVSELVDAMKKGLLKEAFGTGTAATIAQISHIHHDGIDYELPPTETREISNTIFKTLTEIKTGKREDKYGWVHKV